MQGSPVALTEGRSDPALHREDVTQGRPAVGNPRGLEFHAQELDTLVGEHGDEVAAAPLAARVDISAPFRCQEGIAGRLRLIGSGSACANPSDCWLRIRLLVTFTWEMA